MISEIILQTFPVAAIAMVMIIMAASDFRPRRFVSLCIFFISLLTVILSVFRSLEQVAFKDWLNIPLVTWMCFLGYVLRPFCLMGFIILARRKVGKTEWLGMIPLGLNVILYSSSVFLNVPWLRDLCFHFVHTADGTALQLVRGPMNYTSHVLSCLYLLVLIYLSLKMLRGKHRADGYSILICAGCIVLSVVLEMFGLVAGLLNVTIMISCIIYYLFLLKEDNRRDALTEFYDRKTYYADLDRFGKDVSGVIMIDMNGLKGTNDTYGHEAGDESIRAVAKTIDSKLENNMYAYRVGGDEFIILIVKAKRPVEVWVTGLRQAMEDRGCCCAIGFATCEGGTRTVVEAAANADKAMYEDKSLFYRSHPNKNRRHS